MKNSTPIEEKDLDQLLNGLFLEAASSTTDEASARFVFQQKYDIAISKGKENELLNKLNQKPKDPGTYLNFLIVLLVIGVVGTGIYILNQNGKNNPAPSARTVTVEPVQKKNEQPKDAITSTPTIASGSDQNNSATPVMPTLEKAKEDSKLRSDDIAVYYPPSGVGNKSTATFFKPTEQDVLFYNKVKNKMLEKLWSFEKETCTLIEEGEIQYRGNRMTIYPFVLSNHAVTNLEYKVFLTDLIKNGKTEEFKTAIVRNEIWINYNDNILATTYFFDPKYNDFPVVNISSKAVALYCDWLEKEINRYSRQVNPSVESMNVRIPYDSEWLFATEKGYLQMTDCGGYNTIYDMKEDIVDINYLRRLNLIKKQNKNKPTVANKWFFLNRYGWNENQILQLFEKAFSYTDSVDFNKEQLFGKVAHVSEMTTQQPTGKMLIVGSCWKNKQEYTTMLKEFNEVSASPFVGFRIVLSKEQSAHRENF